jgi:hypothetical protein
MCNIVAQKMYNIKFLKVLEMLQSPEHPIIIGNVTVPRASSHYWKCYNPQSIQSLLEMLQSPEHPVIIGNVTVPRASSRYYCIMQANKISSLTQQALHCSASFWWLRRVTFMLISEIKKNGDKIWNPIYSVVASRYSVLQYVSSLMWWCY